MIAFRSFRPSSVAVFALVCAALAAAPSATLCPAQTLEWEALPPIPDEKGFAGSFAGTSGNALLVAGGANFPDAAPWEGGTKRWYDTVFVLEGSTANWRKTGTLPRPLGYGVSISAPEGLICIGGSDAQRHYAECFVLRWSGKQIETQSLPILPSPCANACGALLGRTVYVAGGLAGPADTKALNTFWALDLDEPSGGWKRLASWPGPERMLAVAGVHDGSFFLMSGAALSTGDDGQPVRRWLRDAYRFTPGSGWQSIADLPRVAVAAPSPAPAVERNLLILGGDDGRQVATPPTEHQGFPRDVLAYDTQGNRWTTSDRLPFSLVTTPAVRWQGRIVVAGGESRPAVRSTDVWSGTVVADE